MLIFYLHELYYGVMLVTKYFISIAFCVFSKNISIDIYILESFYVSKLKGYFISKNTHMFLMIEFTEDQLCKLASIWYTTRFNLALIFNVT